MREKHSIMYVTNYFIISICGRDNLDQIIVSWQWYLISKNIFHNTVKLSFILFFKYLALIKVNTCYHIHMEIPTSSFYTPLKTTV